MAGSSTSSFREALQVLRPGPFRRYIVGEGISMTGTWMQTMAQSFVMASLTDRAVWLGAVNLASGIPMLLLTMVGGTVADRADKRLVLIICQLVQIALAVGMGTLVATHRLDASTIWLVPAFALVLGVSNAFEMPAASALVPELVDRTEIGSAVAIDRAVFHATRLVGPAVAGIAVATLGPAVAYYVNALTFLALIVALWSLPVSRSPRAEEENHDGGGFKAGVRHVVSDRPTLAMVSMLAMTTVFVFPFVLILMPLYVTRELHLQATQMGFLMSMAGVGSLSGAVGLLSIPRSRRPAALTLALFLVASALACLSVAHHLAVVAVCLVLMTASVSTMVGIGNTIVQERAPSAIRGRVSAVAGLSFFGLQPIAGMVMPSLSDHIGMRPTLQLAVFCFLLGASYLLFGPARVLSHASQEPEVEPRDLPTGA